MKVLIVEDNEDSRNLLAKQLRAFGHEVKTANNGIDALKQALKDVPDILVSDIQMPHMDGFMLCREWRQTHKLKDIPVVFYTATYISEEDEKFALKLGVNAFVKKPTEPDVLVNILSEIIEKASSGHLTPAEEKPLEQYEYLIEHNKRLVNKLQKKVAALNLEVSEHKKTEDSLRASEERLRSTLDAMLEGYQIISSDWRYLYINPVAAAQGRYELNKYYEHTMTELYPGIEKTAFIRAIKKCMKGKKPDRIENEFTYPDGTKAWYDLSIEPVPEGVLILSVDISERKKAESDVLRINRMLRTISDCNQLLVRATEEKELLDNICDLIVRSEGFPLAWVGFAENDERKTVRPVALAGIAGEYLNNLEISWADNEFGRGPAGIAIRTGETCIARHNTTGGDFTRWRDLAAKYGFNSSIALPLISNGTNIGSLNIYSNDDDAFNKEQLKLLTELADDLAYGITVLRKRHELAIATGNLANSEKQYSTLVERSNDGIIVIQDGAIKFANQQILKMTGFSMEETNGKKLADFVTPEYGSLVTERYSRRMAGEDVPPRYELEIMGKKGEHIPVEINASIIEHEGRPGDMAIIRDITERRKAEEALKESEEKYRLLVENIPVGVNIIRGNEILYANSQVERITGYTSEELNSIDPFNVILEEDRSKIAEYAAMREQGKAAPENYDLRIIRKDGNLRWLRRNVLRIDWLGEQASLVLDNDITERKRAENALKESEERFRQVADNADEWIWEVDADGIYTYSSPAVEKILGYSPEEIVGKKHYYELYPADVREKWKQKMLEIALKKQPFQSHGNPNLHKNGSIVIMDTKAAPVLDNEGNLLGYRGVDEDITERIKAEEALKESERFLDNIIEYSPSSMWIADSGGTIVRVNQSLRDLMKITDERLIGKYNVLKDTQVIEQGLLPLMKSVFEKGKTANYIIDYHTEKEKQVKSSEKVHRVIEAVVSALKDKDGKVINVICQQKDVTAQRQAEEALKESEERYRNFAESTHEIIQSIDRDGDIIFVNKAWHDILGYSEEDLKKITLADIIHPDSFDHCFNMFREVISGKSFNYIEAKFKKKDGSVIYVEGSAAPKFIGDKVIATQGFYADVTERKLAEEALKEEKEYAQNIVNTAQAIILTLDTEGRIVDFNPYLEKISGYSIEEVRGKNWLNIFIPERNRHRTRELFATAIGDKRTAGNIDIIVTRSGQERIVEWYDSIIKDADGRITGLLAVGQDITERRKAEEALIFSDKAFKSIQEGVVVTAMDNIITSWNEASEKICGINAEEAVGNNLWELVRIVDAPQAEVEKEMHQLMTTGYMHSEKQVSVKDKKIWLEISAQLIKDENDINTAVLSIITDITERKRIEQSMTDEATRRRILIEQSRDGIVILDQDGGVYEANQRFVEMLGYEPSEILKLHAWDWEYLLSRDQLFELLSKADEKGDHLETKHRRKDGSIYDVEISTNGAIFAGQKLIFCVCRDITERKKAEEELRESQNLFSTVANTSPALVWMSGTDKMCYWFNEPWLNFTGRTMEQEIGSGWTEGVHPDDLAGCMNTYTQAFDNRQPFSMEYRLRRYDGEYRWIIDKGTPRFDANGNFMGYIGSCIDITERRETEEALRESEERYRFLTDNAKDLIYRYRLLPEPGFEYVSPAAIEMTGYTPEEHYADPDLGFKMLHAEDRQRLTELTQSPENAAGVVVFRWIKRDGSEAWVEQQNTPILDENGQMIAIEGIARDITERKKMEESMVTTDRLASIGELSSGIAHELNNPLTSVIGLIQLLLERNDIPNDILKDLQLVNGEAQRAARVVKNLLIFARKHPNEAQLSSINQAVEKILELRAYDQKVNNIQVVKDFAEDLPQLLIDYFQIQQVFLNIIINAEYAMQEAHNGGTLVIKTELSGEMVRVSFKDDGAGISDKDLKRIFNPFFTTKEVGKGTGLGLSICHGIISQHQGNIYAESEPGKGATFVVELPVNPHEETGEGNDAENR